MLRGQGRAASQISALKLMDPPAREIARNMVVRIMGLANLIKHRGKSLFAAEVVRRTTGVTVFTALTNSCKYAESAVIR